MGGKTALRPQLRPAAKTAFDDASTDRIQFYVFDIRYHGGLDRPAFRCSSDARSCARCSPIRRRRR
jgi:hypothetical protein